MRPKQRTGHRVTYLAISGLALTLVALFVAWFLDNFEPRGVEVEVGYSAAARRNPFLAAERYLRRLGYAVESVHGRGPLRDLPPTRDVLVVNGLGPLNAAHRQGLRDWIEAGGVLIVAGLETTEGTALRPDDFLGGLGIRLRESARPQKGRERERIELEIAAQGEERPFVVSAPANRYLEDTQSRAQAAVIASDGRLRLIQFPLGNGQVTVSADNQFLTNTAIGAHDQAAFLGFIAAPENGGKVWLLYDKEVPALAVTLWRFAPQALVVGVLLVLVFVWHLGRRLGPLLPPPARSRRDLLEHLEASADFLWREGRAAQLSAAARGRVERAWLHRHPPLRTMSRVDRARWIAARLDQTEGGDGTPEAAVWRTLYSSPKDGDSLTADTTLLQSIWVGSRGQFRNL